MTNFEKITETPEALGKLLDSLTAIDTPWEDAFHKAFCSDCELENCDVVECPHEKERDNPTWWLNQEETGGKRAAYRPVWRGGRLRMEPGMEPGAIIPLDNPLRVHIRAVRRETAFGAVMVGEAMSAAWRAVEEVKKTHPDAEISVEVDV